MQQLFYLSMLDIIMQEMDIMTKSVQIGIIELYLLELLSLDPGFSENQYTTLLHHPVTWFHHSI